MSELELMADFYIHLPRQGPGGAKETIKALEYTGLGSLKNLRIADIGCGTGAQTLTLAENLNGKITAVDLFPEFLNVLDENARKGGYLNRITTDAQSMDNLPYENDSFDLIWSEGAVYIMGFENGLKYWRPLIRDGGCLVVSEISWFTESRPAELESYWGNAYAEMDTIESKEKLIKKHGYKLLTSFRLPEYCWTDNYYNPIHDHLPTYIEKYPNEKAAKDLVEELEIEIAMYEKYKKYFGYAFYIARKSKSLERTIRSTGH